MCAKKVLIVGWDMTLCPILLLRRKGNLSQPLLKCKGTDGKNTADGLEKEADDLEKLKEHLERKLRISLQRDPRYESRCHNSEDSNPMRRESLSMKTRWMRLSTTKEVGTWGSMDYKNKLGMIFVSTLISTSELEGRMERFDHGSQDSHPDKPKNCCGRMERDPKTLCPGS